MAVRQDILNALMTTLEDTRSDPSYSVRFKTITDLPEPIDQLRDRLPVLIILDTGGEVVEVRDDTHIRYRWPLQLICYTKSSKAESVQPSVSDVRDSLLQYCDSAPALGSNALQLRAIGVDEIGYAPEAHHLSMVVLSIEIRYWEAR
jgi:hypothetical protein